MMPPLAATTWAIAFWLCSAASAQESIDLDKKNAPPSKSVDGIVGVPIDILKLQGTVVFDVEQKKALATADLVFEMTGEGGFPLFDLRQTVSKASINGKEVSPELLSNHDFGKQAGTMRILEESLAAGAQHTLHLEYEISKPASPKSMDLGWGEGTIEWDFFFSDLNQGRYLEMWFPANLIYDRFGFDLDLQILGAKEKHQIVTNATVTEVKEQEHWKLSFADSFTSFSQMLVVIPDLMVDRSTSKVKIAGGRTILIDVCRRLEVNQSLKEVHKATADELKRFSKSTAPWPHGDRCTVFVWTGGRSMEYDGATTTSMGALSHELFHSWFGRGLKPMTQNDGWFDEAWDVWFADGGRHSANRLKGKTSPVRLHSSNPYNRVTTGRSYSYGSMFFSRLAKELGEKELMKLMAEFFDEYHETGATTAEMAQFLFAKSKNKNVPQLFHRYVYGKEGSVMDLKKK
jgi:hypothetical protein